HSTQHTDDGGNADLKELGVGAMAVSDVRRGNLGVLGGGPGGGLGAWLRRLVGPVEDQVGGVEVKVLQGQFREVNGLGGDGGEDGMALREERIQGPATSSAPTAFSASPRRSGTSGVAAAGWCAMECWPWTGGGGRRRGRRVRP